MSKEFLTKKNILSLLGLILVAVALPVVTLLVKQRQEVRKEAAVCSVDARSTVKFYDAAGGAAEIINANNGQEILVKAYLTGPVDAADIVLGFNTTKLEWKSGGIGSPTESGTANVKRILFTYQKAPAASAGLSNYLAGTARFKVIAPTTLPAADQKAQIVYGGRTTIAYNGAAGGAGCGTDATLPLNGTGPTNTPGPTATPGGPTATPTIPPTCGNGVLDAGEVCDKDMAFCITGKNGAQGCVHACAGGAGGYSGYPNSGRYLSCKSDCSGYREGGVSGVGTALCWSGCTADPAAAQEEWGTETLNVGDACPSGGVMNASCQCVASLPTNTPTPTIPGSPTATPTRPAPTATPTTPAVGINNFSLGYDDSTEIPTAVFATDVYFNSQGVSTKNFQMAYTYDVSKIKVASVTVVDAAHIEPNSNNSGSGYFLIRTKAGNAFAKVYGIAGGAGEKIGSVTFVFQGTNKQANVTFDAATSGSWINVTLGGAKVAATGRSYCYFMTGGTCGTSPTATPTQPVATTTPTQPAATNTPAPTATPVVFPTTTPNPMDDNALYLSDDLPTNVTPGQAITAHITMKNTGTTTWRATERFHGLSASPQCSGSACLWGSSGVLVIGTVAPQATYQFTLNLTAPTTAGTYDAFWQMVQSGALFGQRGGKRITVAAAAITPTPTVPACTKKDFPDATGAANGGPDGKVCMADLQKALDEIKHTNGINTTTADFDCPPNGVVSGIDIQHWLNYVNAHGVSSGCGN